MTSSNQTYKTFADYYDIYVRNYSEDLAFYLSLCSNEYKILEVGCGTGRILQYVLDNGLKITGIDISEEMLKKARTKLKNYIENKKLFLFNHNLSDKPFKELFHVCIISFYTFNYILEKPEIFLNHLYKSLHKDSIIAIDLFYPSIFNNPAIDDVWIDKEFNYHERLIRIRDKRTFKENIENRVQVYHDNGHDTHIETLRRYYPPDEIKHLLLETGFTNIEFSAVFDQNGFQSGIDEEKINRNYIVKARKQL